MGIVSMLLDGPAAGARPGLTGLARASIRSWAATTFGAYLAQTGKARWCDKSLGSAESANRFLDLFPQTKFICLYRHCMDVIDSALEACPFGLRGYGLDPFAAAHTGNAVAAVADYWVTHTRTIAEFEQAHPEACLRLRYEDLVADPEAQAERIFTFLGEEPVPGITSSFLAADRAQFGPGDHKIWSTSGVSSNSVGRGKRIPVQLISPTVLALANGLLERLGYPVLDEHWNELAPMPVTPDLTDASAATRGQSAAAPPDLRSRAVGAAVLDELEELLAGQAAERLAAPGPALAEAPAFNIIATTGPSGTGTILARGWRIDPAAVTIARVDGDGVGGVPAAEATGEWGVIGDAQSLWSVLAGQLNLGTAFRQGLLRFTGGHDDDTGTPSPLRADPRSGFLTRLLMPATTGPGQAAEVIRE
jgi:hypothetical protein